MNTRRTTLHASRFESLEPRCLLDSASPALEAFSNLRRNVHAVETADFDGDGDMDMAVWLSSAGPNNPWKSVLFVLRNDGDGNFEQIAQLRLKTEAGSITAGDFDNDGTDELAIAVERAAAAGSRIRIFGLDVEAGRLRAIANLFQGHTINQLEGVPAGANGDSLLLFHSNLFDDGPFAEARIFRLAGSSLQDQGVVFSISGSYITGVRIVDADGDAFNDILFSELTPQDPSDLFAIKVNLYVQDASTAGSFAPAQELVSYEGGVAAGSPLLTDVDDDGLLDVVAATRDDVGIWRVMLFRGELGGTFQPLETILQRTFTFPTFGGYSLLGAGVGPTGAFEIWVVESYSVGGGSLSSGTVELARLVRQDDESFEHRVAFTHAVLPPNISASGLFHVANLTDDSAIDFLAVTRLSGLSPRRAGAVMALTFDGSNSPPLFRAPTVSVISPLNAQTVSNRDTIRLYAWAFDPEAMIGEVGGIRRVRFYLDVNNNGMIDDADFMFAAGTTQAFDRIVRARWPRGTFGVLVQAVDIEGNLSGVCDTQQSLTIV